jgi:hypothetical protein
MRIVDDSLRYPVCHTIKASERPHHAGCFEKNLACLGVADKDFGLGILGRSYWLLWLS